jgi:hypothetical protein
MTMSSPLVIHLDGIGLYGPGLSGWPHAADVLADRATLEIAPIKLSAPDALPPAERRRVGMPIKLTFAIGFEAVSKAGANPAELRTVFSSTDGDCDNCHAILETLATPDRTVSPTRFHNSVHNAPSGYWSIATRCQAASTSLCAYNGSFAAGLLEAVSQAIAANEPCLLLSYDTTYPEPMASRRPILGSMGVGLLLSPFKTKATLASLTIGLANANAMATPMASPALETLRTGIPTARCLPLMQLLARRTDGSVLIDYLDDLNLTIGCAHVV